MDAVILKLDLSRAYDRVDWGLLRLILLQIGLPIEVVRWIMGCITTANFFVLVNGAPTSFFGCGRGLRQGCPLSPILFLLVIEGLSRLLTDARISGRIKGVLFNSALALTHILFVDDVIIYGMGDVEDWTEINRILKLFCCASGMQLNFDKSCFIFHKQVCAVEAAIKEIIPVKSSAIGDGL